MVTPVGTTHRPARRTRRVWVVLGSLVLAVALAGAALIWRAASSVDHVSQAPLLPTEAPAAAAPGAPSPAVRPTRPAEAGDSLNVVVVRTGGEGQPLTTIALVHANDPRSRVDVVTVPPDTTAPGASGTLVDVYASEGTAGVVRAVESLFQVPADHAAEVNDEGFAALTSLMSADALANPVAADKAVTTVMQNITVDEAFTSEKLRALAMDLITTGTPHTHVVDGPSESGESVDRLRTALRTDDFASL